MMLATLIQQDFHWLQSPSENTAMYRQAPAMQPSLQYLRRNSSVKSPSETLNGPRVALYLQKKSCWRAGASHTHHTLRNSWWWKRWATQLWKAALCHHLDGASMQTGQYFTRPESNRTTSGSARKGAAAQAASREEIRAVSGKEESLFSADGAGMFTEWFHTMRSIC